MDVFDAHLVKGGSLNTHLKTLDVRLLSFLEFINIMFVDSKEGRVRKLGMAL